MKKGLFFILYLFLSLNTYSQNVIVSIKSLKSVFDNILSNPNINYQSSLSPHDVMLTTNQIKSLKGVEFYISTGLIDFEKQSIDYLKKNSPNTVIISISDYISTHNDDIHIWLSLHTIKAVLDNVKNTKLKDYIDNDKYKKYYESLDSLIKKYEKLFANLKGKSIMTYHNAFYYLLTPFGINQESISVHEDIKPSITVINQKINFIKKNNIKYIFVEEEFDESIGRKIAKKVNINVIRLNLFKDNLLQNLDDILNQIYKSI